MDHYKFKWDKIKTLEQVIDILSQMGLTFTRAPHNEKIYQKHKECLELIQFKLEPKDEKKHIDGK